MPAPFSERNLTIIAILAALFVACIGLFVFFSRYQYSEDGTNMLILGYLVACLIFLFSIRIWNIPLFVVSVVLLLGVQIYATQKFSWRQNYVELAQKGQPFALSEYIDHYPTFEEYTFKFLKKPDWVRFNTDCVQPALVYMPVPPRCATPELIQLRFNIDIVQAMQLYYGKMKRTASMVAEGKLNKRSAYAECIANKICVSIPLLPKGVDADKLDPSSRDYIGIRQAFWSIINEKKMSPETCSLTTLCRALVAMKAVEPDKLPF